MKAKENYEWSGSCPKSLKHKTYMRLCHLYHRYFPLVSKCTTYLSVSVTRALCNMQQQIRSFVSGDQKCGINVTLFLPSRNRLKKFGPLKSLRIKFSLGDLLHGGVPQPCNRPCSREPEPDCSSRQSKLSHVTR